MSAKIIISRIAKATAEQIARLKIHRFLTAITLKPINGDGPS